MVARHGPDWAADEEEGISINIGNAAQRSGVPPKTIRYYENSGLVRRAERDGNGYRQYEKAGVQTLRFIKRARSLGFSVREVASLLELWRDRDRKSADVQALALGRINQIEFTVKELKSPKSALNHLMENCQGDERPDCPIIDARAENSKRQTFPKGLSGRCRNSNISAC